MTTSDDYQVETRWMGPERMRALLGLERAGDWMPMSASELGSPQLIDLHRWGYVEMKNGGAGPVWRITERGKGLLAERREKDKV